MEPDKEKLTDGELLKKIYELKDEAIPDLYRIEVEFREALLEEQIKYGKITKEEIEVKVKKYAEKLNEPYSEMQSLFQEMIDILEEKIED